MDTLLEPPPAVIRPAVVAVAAARSSPPLHAPPAARPAHTGWQVERAQETRQGALSRWSALLRLAPALFGDISGQILDNDVRQELRNLEFVFCKKSTNTLLNRAASLKRFVLWSHRRFPSQGLSEPLLFLYLQEIQADKASPSTADSLLQALGFCWGTLGLSVHLQILRSPRVTGLAHVQLKERRPPRQAPPLTVAQVSWLERCAQADPPSYESLIAGGLCFALFARARNSDLNRSVEIDFDWASDAQSGFVETKVLNPKQARAAAQRNKLLPLVAPVQGLHGPGWARSWLRARQVFHLTCKGKLGQDHLLPALAADGSLLPAALSSCEAARWLRAILSRDPQADHESILGLTSHCLKVTLLSWTAKAGVVQDAQTLLGYHSLGLNMSSLNYSRDALSGPLRELERILGLVRAGNFCPDDTRSGRWTSTLATAAPSTPASGSAGAPSQDPLPDSESDSSSSQECQSSDSEDDQLVVTDATHSLSLIVESGRYSFMLHDSSAICHVMDKNLDRFLCGRSVFGKYSVCKSLGGDSNRLCHVCNNVALGTIAGQWA